MTKNILINVIKEVVKICDKNNIKIVREILIENYEKIDFKYLKKWARKFNVEIFLKDELESAKRVREIE